MTPAADCLFVYGTLVDSNRRRRLLGREIEAEPAQLDGYARGRGRYYFVVARAGATVEGGILRGLSSRDFAIIDEYEEVPRLYTRQSIIVRDHDAREVECWIYLPTGWERRSIR
jgi:gamma-glutamylcyclotransferase (GGCT)/AIG2-like uncharacterized protein YtfP